MRNTRQVSIVSMEELAEIATALHLPEGCLSGSAPIRGIDNLTMLPPATRIVFPGEAVLVVDAENLPYAGPGEIIQERCPDLPKLAQRFPKAAIHKRRVVGWVEREGETHDGDTIWLLLPPM